MRQIGFSVIAIGSGEELFATERVPARFDIPNMGVVDFDRAGLVAPDSENAEVIFVERWLENEPPAYAHVQTGESVSFDGTKAIVARTYQQVPEERRLVEKALIVDRLIAAGKLEAARLALDAAPLDVREKWNVRTAIYADDPTALGLLMTIGADPAVILAPED